ncbi:MAG: polymer-forming cytoskeletal protein [Bacillaceae bacterium]|nr:polymer-forming cytoskeletal protein [Bacillaceae bacterium]
MFNGKNAKIEKVDTVVGDGTTFVGNIQATGIVRVDGKLEGELETQGDIIVGEKGEVEGSVKGRNVTVAGRITGNVISDEKLHLLSTGVIEGDIDIKTLIVDEGSKYYGECNMKDDDAKGKGKNKKNKDKNKDNKNEKDQSNDKDSK